MIVFCNANGTVTSVLPSPVYQGSALSGGLYFLAPVPKTNSVTVAFELADGTVTDSYLLTPVIQGLENIVDTLGETYSVWEWQTKDKRITEQPGVVTAQFSIGHFSGEEGNSEFQGQTTAAVTFTVQKGVAPLPTETPRADQWATLIALYSEIKGTFDKIENIDENATKAETAASNAAGKAIEAGASAYNAKQSEDNALTYKTAAETAKDTATAKAQEASESATAAATSATEAQSAANTATEKAAEATQAAENATAVTEQAINARIVQTTGNSDSDIMSQKAVTDAVKETKNNIADLKEALYGYVLDTAEVETDSVIPSTVEVSGTTYNLVDDVRGLVKEIKGGTVKSNNLFDASLVKKSSDIDNGSILEMGSNYFIVQGNISDSPGTNLYTNGWFKPLFNYNSPNKLYLKAGDIITISAYYTVLEDNSVSGYLSEANIYLYGAKNLVNQLSRLPSVGVKTRRSITYTIPDGGDGYYYLVFTLNSSKIKIENIQVELGDTATDYKPYFAGLKSVEYTGLEVKGKNLFNISKYAGSYSSNSTYELIGNSIKLNITGKDAYVGVQNDNKMAFEVEPNTTYYFSCDYTNTNNTLSEIIIGIFNSEKVWTNNIFMFSNGLLKGSFTTNDSTYYLSFRFGSNSVENEISTSIFSNIMVVKGSTAPTEYKPYREQTILPFTTTLRGVDTYKDKIIITKNESDDYYTATKETNCEAVEYTSGDENNAEYITDLTTTVKPLATPTTEVLSTTLTESDVMPLLELGGSVEIINENSLYITGSTALEMVYKLINNTTTTSEVTE